MTNFDDLFITNQNFFIVLSTYGRYHFNSYKELVKYCKSHDLVVDDQDIRLGYDSSLTLNTFAFYDHQDYINGELIRKVERNQYRKTIESFFEV